MRIGKAGAAESHICQAYADRVEVRGHDLCNNLMGRMSFTDYFHLLLTGREPTTVQREFLDILLISIAEHGMMPTNIVARMTLAADPASLQGAVAAGFVNGFAKLHHAGRVNMHHAGRFEAHKKDGEPYGFPVINGFLHFTPAAFLIDQVVSTSPVSGSIAASA
jgi:hypothetical protein